MFLRRKLGWPIIIALSLSPLILWYFALLPFSSRFYNTYSTFTTLGEISSLIGITMFSLSLILSARMEIFEDFFGGMNRVYISHHILGGISFIFLLIHPLLLAFSRVTISWYAAALFLLPGEDWSINVGIAGLLFMISLLLITFFIKIPYQIWRFTHKFLGAVFLIGAIHGFYVSSDIQRFKPLQIYMLIIIGLGALAYCYHTLLGRFLVRRTKYVVAQILMVKDNVTEITLKPVSKLIKAIPGQFIFVYFQSSHVSKETHPFSISAVYPDGSISIAIKAEGDYTQTLKTLQNGEIGVIEGGFGRFTYSLYKNKRQVWIAGGIGIVPFLSMAQNLTDPEYQIYLYYSVRTEDEAVYLDNLMQMSQLNPNLHIIPFYSKTMGRLSAETIAQTVQDLTQFDFFLCGPPPMMRSMRTQLKKLHVKDSSIHSEEFSL
jgi:predicted ferric reductase